MVSKDNIIQTFNPSGVGIDNGNLFGFPFDDEMADIIILSVPWDVTVSYRAGTAFGPQAILTASPQLDFYDFDYPDGWKQGIFMPEIPNWILQKNQELRTQSAQIIEYVEQGNSLDLNVELLQILDKINQECRTINHWLFETAKLNLNRGKKVAVMGGDHSVPLGYIQALADRYSNFGILQIDAHADLRKAYEGFEFSHASIMHNVLKLPQVSKLVQVGVRDICQDEVVVINAWGDRISTYYDSMLKQQRYAGVSWLLLCQQMVEQLPQQVYVSFDVDGLDPKLCPHTGTPVPGGLELEEAFFLLRHLVQSGRQIIGFDLCEVGNDTWDGNVGARIVYKLCNLMGTSCCA